VSRFPADFRPPAFASRSSDSRRGIRPSSRSAYRATARTPTGLPRSARMSCDRGGCPLYPEDGGALPGQVVSLTGACRFSAASPCTPLRHPIGGASLHEASTGVHAIHPSGLPLACGRPDGTGRPRAFPRASNPAGKSPATHVEVGTGHRARAWNYTLNITSADPPIRVVHSQRATSRRTTTCERPPARDRSPSRSCIHEKAAATH
jgi:hypothetical protein